MEVILASQSPRRRELMGLFRIPFTVRVSDADETMDPKLTAAEAVGLVSHRKAEAVSREGEGPGGDAVTAWSSTATGPAGSFLTRLPNSTDRGTRGWTQHQAS